MKRDNPGFKFQTRNEPDDAPFWCALALSIIVASAAVIAATPWELLTW